MSAAGSDGSAAPADLDRLDAMNREVGMLLVAAIGDEQWDEARFFCRYQPEDEFYRTAIRFRIGRERSSAEVPDEADDVMRRYQEAFRAVNGSFLPRLRFDLEPTGRFRVDYRYEDVEGRIKWGWPDDEDWAGPT